MVRNHEGGKSVVTKCNNMDAIKMLSETAVFCICVSEKSIVIDDEHVYIRAFMRKLPLVLKILVLKMITLLKNTHTLPVAAARVRYSRY